MLKALYARLRQGYRTGAFPPAPPTLPEKFRGVPEVPETVTAECAAKCPTGALEPEKGTLDLGKCIFCGECGLAFDREYRLGVFRRGDLVLTGNKKFQAGDNPDRQFTGLCGQSLRIRQVSAGGCAACELDFNVLHTLAWDMGRFGIQAVASPRHADVLLVTGPVTENMRLALQKTYDAMPAPKRVIACGCCAISGGLYAASPCCKGPLDVIVPVDLYVPGCPPHPAVLLEALLRLMGKPCGK